MLINFEGVDGVGKSTQINLLKQAYPDAIITKEPGGTQLGQMIREYLMSSASKISGRAEIFLFLADRAEHYEKVLKPNYGNLILSDRSFVSRTVSAASDAALWTASRKNSPHCS